MATIEVPQSARAIGVQPGQLVAMEADGSTDWWYRNLTSGGDSGPWTQINTGGAAQRLVWETPSSVTNRWTFDRLQVAVNTGAAPTTGFTGGLRLNLCEGPPAVLFVSPQLPNAAMSEPPLRPWEGEDDDPPLGAPLFMAGANRDGLGTTALETAGSTAGGPANLVQAWDRGLFVDTAGRLGVRVAFTNDVRGAGPFPAIASYHHGGLYFQHDFGRSRTLGLTRVLYEDADGHVAVVRGDGRRNTYRSTGGGQFEPAAGLHDELELDSGVFTETTPSGREYRYASGGRLEQVVDRCGNPVYYSYDTNGRLQKIQGVPGALGLVPYLSYDGNGQLTRLVLEDPVTPANNRVSYLQYDGNRNLVRIIGPESCITYMSYDETGARLTAVTDPDNYTWSAGYDGDGRVDRIVDAATPRATSYLAYDVGVPRVRLRDRAGKVTYLDFNAFGSPEQVSSPGTPADEYAYDGEGNLISTQNRVGGSWSYEYDGEGNRISATDPLGARAYFAYDGDDLRAYVDPLGRATYLTYDGQRNRERWIDPLGQTVYYQYEPTGLLRSKRDRRGAFTYLGYDARGNLTAANDALGQTTYLGYDPANEQTAQVDPLGRVTYLQHDKRGRVVLTLDPLGAPTYLAYDARCNLVSQRDARLNQTRYEYDGNSNRTRVIDALGQTTYLFYDPEERPSTRVDAQGRPTYWSYDALGRRQKETDALGGVTYLAYTDAHQPSLNVDARGNPTYLRYDAASRTQHQVDANFEATYLGYDLKGRQVRSVAPGFAQATAVYWTDSGNDTIKRFDRATGVVTTVVSTGLSVPRGAVADPVRGFLYWIDSGTDTISRWPLGGGAVTPIVSTGSGTPRDLAIDFLNGWIYWIDSGDDTIKRAPLAGGTGTTVRSTGAGTTPEGLALDAQGQKLYWTDSQTPQLQRCNVDGSSLETVVNTGLASPAGLALDVADRQVYWVDASTGTIHRAGMDGLNQGVATVLSGLVTPRAIDLDLVERKMYWVDSGSGGDKLEWANLDGSDREALVSSGLSTPEGIALALAPRVTDTAYDELDRVTTVTDAVGAVRTSTYDAEGNVLRRIDPRGYTTYMTYDPLGRVTHTEDAAGGVTYAGYDAAGQSVLRLDALGYPTYLRYDLAGRQQYATNALLQTTYHGYDLVGNSVRTLPPSEATWIYWTDSANGSEAIKRCRPDGTQLETLVTAAQLDVPRGIVVDAQHGHMYWVDSGNDTLKRADLDGSGVATILSSGLSTPRGLAIDVDAGHLYWLDSGNDTLKRSNLDGSGVTTILNAGAGGFVTPEGIALDLTARKVYWTDSGNVSNAATIKRANMADGSNVQTLVSTNLQSPNEIDLDVLSGHMYWVDSGNDTIKRASMEDGSGETTLVSSGLSTPRGLRLDLAARVMYFVDSGNDTLKRANLDGTIVVETILSSGLTTPEDMALEIPVRVTTRAYDAVNRQVTTTDPYGAVSTTVYDLVGNVERQVNARGYATYMTYDGLNRRTHTIDPVHFAATYMGYDAVGNTVLQLDALGAPTYLTYDRLNRTSLTIDAAGLATYLRHDEVGARTFQRQVLGAGGAERLTYHMHDAVGRVFRQVAPDEGQTYMGYDQSGNQTLTVDSAFRPTYLAYDALGRQEARSNAFGNTWRTDYDLRSSVIRQRDPEGRTAYMAYDALGRLANQSNALGEYSYMAYDPRGNRARVQNPRGYSTYLRYDLLDRQSQRSDALGGVAYMGYDPVGNQVLSQGPEETEFLGLYWASASVATIDRARLNGVQPTTVFSGDTPSTIGLDLTTPGGKLYWLGVPAYGKRSNLDGTMVESILDGSDFSSVVAFTLDPAGGRLYVSDFINDDVRSTTLGGQDLQMLFSTSGDAPRGLAVDSARRQLYYTRYSAGDLRRIDLDGGGDALVVGSLSSPWGVALDLIHHKVYWVEYGASRIRRANLDGSGVETIVSSLSQPSDLAVDPVRGRIYWKEISPSQLRSATLTGADVQTVLTSVQAFALSIPQRVTLSAHDGLNRTTLLTDALGGQTYMGYDARSSLVRRVDADGRATYMAYDLARRLERQYFTNPVETADAPIYYTYDQVGNLLTSDDSLAGLGVSAFEYDELDRVTTKVTVAGPVYYSYDLSGMKTEVKDPNLEAVGSAYDAAGRLIRTTVVASPNRESYFHYDDAGLIEKKILSGNRVLSYYSYDPAGRLSLLVNLDSTASQLTYFAYQRNPNGAVTRINHESNEWTYFTYDALDRLTEERRTQNPTIYGFEYEYDAASNRTRKEDLVSAAVTSYSPNALNLIESETTGAVETVYEYDQSQRMKTRYSADEATYFSHNQRDLPTKLEFALASGTPDNTREFNYTGTGERAAIVGELGSGYETLFAFDGSRVLVERDEFDNTYGQYRWGSPQHGGGLIESSNPAEAGPEEGPVMDERGSVDKLVGASGRVVYDRFGVELANNLASSTRTRFVAPAFLRLGTSGQFSLTATALFLPSISALTIGRKFFAPPPPPPPQDPGDPELVGRLRSEGSPNGLPTATGGKVAAGPGDRLGVKPVYDRDTNTVGSEAIFEVTVPDYWGRSGERKRRGCKAFHFVQVVQMHYDKENCPQVPREVDSQQRPFWRFVDPCINGKDDLPWYYNDPDFEQTGRMPVEGWPLTNPDWGRLFWEHDLPGGLGQGTRMVFYDHPSVPSDPNYEEHYRFEAEVCFVCDVSDEDPPRKAFFIFDCVRWGFERLPKRQVAKIGPEGTGKGRTTFFDPVVNRDFPDWGILR